MAAKNEMKMEWGKINPAPAYYSGEQTDKI